MRKLILLTILVMSLTIVSGCGPGTTSVLGGIAGGFAGSETLKGMKADLEQREQQLIDRYAEAVKAGAKQEVLDKIDQKITETQYMKEGVESTEKLLGVDWNDPRQAGESIMKIGVLLYAILTKRKLLRTEKGVNKFMANSDKATANKVFDTINKT